jgi:hypothetical protein
VLVPEQWRQQILDDPAGSGLDLHAHGQPGERLTRLWSTRIWVRSIDTRAAWSNSRPAGSLEPLAAPWIFPLELSFGLSRLMASCEMLSKVPCSRPYLVNGNASILISESWPTCTKPMSWFDTIPSIARRLCFEIHWYSQQVAELGFEFMAYLID